MSSTNPYAASDLVRAAFCSEANFSHWADPRGAELEVARILHPAPRNQHFDAVGGIFHAGNRYYLQVIEGPAESVDWYLNHMASDQRHQRFKVLSTDPIKHVAFNAGKMRFIGNQKDMHAIQDLLGDRAFNPYDYNQQMLESFVALALSPQSST